MRFPLTPNLASCNNARQKINDLMIRPSNREVLLVDNTLNVAMMCTASLLPQHMSIAIFDKLVCFHHHCAFPHVTSYAEQSIQSC